LSQTTFSKVGLVTPTLESAMVSMEIDLINLPRLELPFGLLTMDFRSRWPSCWL